MKSFDEEKKCLEWLFDHGGEDIVVLDRLATLCIGTGDLDQAFEAINRARQIAPSNHQVLCTLGLIHKQRKQMPEAIQTYMQAVESQPDGVDAWISLGEISIDLDRLDEARVFFERALCLRFGLVKVLLQLCEIELKQNKMLEFVHWCDLLLKELQLNRDKILYDVEDIVAVLFEIDFAARNTSGVADQILKLLSLLPVDFECFRHTRIGAFLENKDAEETEFILREVEKLSQTRKPPQAMQEEIVSHL
jgi:tetratricopeptide (TPR) repeat protein